MVRILLALFIFLPLSSVFATTPSSALRFSPLPMLSEHLVKEQFLSFCSSLAELTDQNVSLIYKKDYQELLDALHNDEVDLAYLGPLPYVMARRTDNDIVPVVRFLNRQQQATYTCSLVTFGDNQPNLDSAYSTVALTQPYSTCGYLATESLLAPLQHSLSDCPYTYVGDHEQAALSVIRGDAVLAGVKTTIARQYENLGLTIIDESPPLPGFLLVANRRTLDPATIDRLREDLLALNETVANGAKSPLQWGKMIRYGMIEANDKDYDPIRDLLTRFPVPEISP
jgi:phosphonate transport system substrate-binding protein